MIGILGVATLLALAPAAQSHDTTLSVQRGARLSVETRAGTVDVDTWSRPAVRVLTNADADATDIHAGAGTVSVETRASFYSRAVHYRITVPAWMPMRVEAQSSDVHIEGAGDEVRVQTLRGDIDVRGGRGYTSLKSVQGTITVADARGRVEVGSVAGRITVRHVNGEVRASTVNGGITLDDITGRSVTAEAVNGGITFRGAFQPSGYYSLSSHNGGIRVLLPGPPNAQISVTTFNGQLDSDFPLQLQGVNDGKHMSFTAGSGSARVELESFNGTVSLKRQASGGGR